MKNKVWVTVLLVLIVAAGTWYLTKKKYEDKVAIV